MSISSWALFFIAAGPATWLAIKGKDFCHGIGLLQTGMSEPTSEADLSAHEQSIPQWFNRPD